MIQLQHYPISKQTILIPLDVKMLQMNGSELYQEIKKKDDKVKACFITAKEVYYELIKQQFPKLEVGCCIRKPIDMDDLVKRIDKELFESNKHIRIKILVIDNLP